MALAVVMRGLAVGRALAGVDAIAMDVGRAGALGEHGGAVGTAAAKATSAAEVARLMPVRVVIMRKVSLGSAGLASPVRTGRADGYSA
jgi:hypothetical protein